jgi:hypothetical protein
MEPDSKAMANCPNQEDGGVAMQGIGWTPESERRAEVAHVIMGVLLFILVMGIWTCLWVPPPPIF